VVRLVLARVFGVRSDGVAIPEALGIVDGRVGTNWATAASGVGRGGAAGPIVRIRMWLELLVDVEHVVADTVDWVADLNVVVVPTELLIGLRARKEVSATEEIAYAGDYSFC